MPQLGVQTGWPSQQRVVRPSFRHSAMLQYQNLIRVHHRWQTMRDANRGPIFSRSRQCLHNFLWNKNIIRANQSINRSIDQSTNQSNDQSNNQLIDRSVNQTINWSIDRSINQSINWSIGQSINQSINRTINQFDQWSTIFWPALWWNPEMKSPRRNTKSADFSWWPEQWPLAVFLRPTVSSHALRLPCHTAEATARWTDAAPPSLPRRRPLPAGPTNDRREYCNRSSCEIAPNPEAPHLEKRRKRKITPNLTAKFFRRKRFWKKKKKVFHKKNKIFF